MPSTAAVIVAEPAATPVTIPDEETVAAAGFEVDQAKVRDSAWPAAYFAVAESCIVSDGTSVPVSDDIVTIAVVGGGGGPVTPSPPPHDPMIQPSPTRPVERRSLFIIPAGMPPNAAYSATQVTAHD